MATLVNAIMRALYWPSWLNELSLVLKRFATHRTLLYRNEVTEASLLMVLSGANYMYLVLLTFNCSLLMCNQFDSRSKYILIELCNTAIDLSAKNTLVSSVYITYLWENGVGPRTLI